MRPHSLYCLVAYTLMAIFSSAAFAQATVDDDQLGGWYMYFWSLPGEENKTQGRLGLQGDIQYRN